MSIDLNSAETVLILIVAAALFLLVLGQSRFYTQPRAHGISLAAVAVSLLIVQPDLFSLHAIALRPELFSGMLVYDTFAAFFITLFLAGVLLTLAIGGAYMREAACFRSEAYVLLLLALAGMIVLSMAKELLSAFLALEIASMAVYILVGLRRSRAEAAEAFFKYLMLGAFMGSFYLLGMALVYAQTGSTHLADIAAYLAQSAPEARYLVAAGGVLMMATVLFKIAAVPFGIWVLDVYEGASLPVTAFMAGTFKVAVFALALRLYVAGYLALETIYTPMLLAAALATLVIGSLAAVVQQRVARMLAASSIVHSGYLLIGLSATGELTGAASSAILFYLVAYMLSAVGAFGLLSVIGRGFEGPMTYDDLKGLAARHPAAALGLSIFMLSLAGFPSTIGFLGKFYIFTAAIESGYLWLALIGALAAFVSIYYYFRVIVMLYFHPPREQPLVMSAAPVAMLFVLLCAAAVLWGGIGTGLITLLPGADIITQISKLGFESLHLL